MVSERLRELALAAEGAGELTGEDVRLGVAEHPVCGDQVQLSVRFAGDAVAELRWRAVGCPATMAVATLASTALSGRPVADCAAALRDALAQHGGLAAHERHAEGLILRALAMAHGGA